MDTIENTVDIKASTARVWAALTDFGAYKRWNPFIPAVDGEARPGARLTVHIAIGAGATVPVQAEIVTFEPGAELVWRSHLLIPGVFDRDHRFRIEATPEGCTLKQTQIFAGPLASTAAFLTTDVVRRGLAAMNAGLKGYAEASSPA